MSLQLKWRHLVQWGLCALWRKHDVFCVLVQPSDQLRHPHASGAFKGWSFGCFQSPKFILKWLPVATCFQLSTSKPEVHNNVDIVLHKPVKTALTTSCWAQRVHIPSKTNTFANVLILFQLLHIIVRFISFGAFFFFFALKIAQQDGLQFWFWESFKKLMWLQKIYCPSQ